MEIDIEQLILQEFRTLQNDQEGQKLADYVFECEENVRAVTNNEQKKLFRDFIHARDMCEQHNQERLVEYVLSLIRAFFDKNK